MVRGAWWPNRGAWCVVAKPWCVVRGAWCVHEKGCAAERRVDLGDNHRNLGKPRFLNTYALPTKEFG